jgi:hypothetical protein
VLNLAVVKKVVKLLLSLFLSSCWFFSNLGSLESVDANKQKCLQYILEFREIFAKF